MDSLAMDSLQEESAGEVTQLPDCWNTKQWSYFKDENPWLYLNSGHVGCFVCKEVKAAGGSVHGMRISSEWAEGKVGPSGTKKSFRQKQIRKKISEHKASGAHLVAEEICKTLQNRTVEEAVQQSNATRLDSTCRVFITAYYLAKNNCPFTDYPNLIKLLEMSGSAMGRVLHSNVTAAEIVRHIAVEMQQKLVCYIKDHKTKITVIVDENTNILNKPALIIYLRGAFGDQSKPVTVFFGLVELQEINSLATKMALLQYFENVGISMSLLNEIWIAVCSDGPAIVFSKEVIDLLRSDFPNIALSWHCLAHRLELVVADVIDYVAGINHFKIFMDSLYATYSMSPRNARQLEMAANELVIQLQKIGKMLDTRWVASSYGTVRAVWHCFPALCKHFEDASKDPSRPTRDRGKYEGLLNKLTSCSFIKELGLMCDALEQLNDLSELLQRLDMTIVNAHRCLLNQVHRFTAMKDTPGKFATIAQRAAEEGQFMNIQISKERINFSSLNPRQFYESLSVMLNERCRVGSDAELIESFSVLDQENLLVGGKHILYGEVEVGLLCSTFHLPLRETIDAYRCFKDSGGKKCPEALMELVVCMKTLPANSADCERGLGAMNLIVSPTRSSHSATVCSCLWLNLNGPPLNAFEPLSYVESWLAKGRRSAEERHCEKPHQKKDDEEHLKAFWEILS
ncbi:hypothetical protein NDU88_003642 [Pleurodeles waltl]|uniref:DUF4371 domain-containing protein n=1 Tax=Pleurodeles waltl TaxID=8319 RepID=A0AAV7QCA1_PLEWA|nr:hypothetical protein NDU88_003642 [Pleurodeles waltl]